MRKAKRKNFEQADVEYGADAPVIGHAGSRGSDQRHPLAEEVFRDIGLTVASFLALALAVNLLLNLFGL